MKLFRSHPPSVQVGLASCTKTKLDHPAPPRDLYEPSALFRKARQYCERHHDEWYVLSAKHGLLAPDAPEIEPYDETLADVGVDKRQTWADRVADELDAEGLLSPETELVVHAGRAYYEYLVPAVEPEVATVTLPTEGLAIGETLAWYDEHT